MKAIFSPIPLIILFIVVTAFVGFSYIIFTQFLGGSPLQPYETHEANMFAVDDVRGGNIIYIKNTGTRSLITEKIKVYIDESPSPCIFDVDIISPGEIEVCEIPVRCNFGSLLKVRNDINSDIITCPSSSGIVTTATSATSIPSTTVTSTTTPITATSTTLPQITTSSSPITSTTQQTTSTIISGITTPENLREIQQCAGPNNVEVNLLWNYSGQADNFELAIDSYLDGFPGSTRQSGFIYEFPSGTNVEWEITAFYGNQAESQIKTFQTITC